MKLQRLTGLEVEKLQRRIKKLRAFQIPYSSRTAKGLPIVNLLNFEQNEKLAAVLNVNMEKIR